MALTEKFVAAPEPLVSYDFSDIAGGTGSIAFSTFVADLSGSNLYALETEEIDTLGPSQGGTNTIVGNGAGAAEVNKITFETQELKLPRLIWGKVWASFTWSLLNGTGSNSYGFIVMKVLKNDDVIAQLQTSSITVNNGTNATRTSTLGVDMPKTFIAVGDKIKVSFHGENTSGVGVVTRLYHDVDNRSDTTNTPNITASTNHTDLKIYIPFVID